MISKENPIRRLPNFELLMILGVFFFCMMLSGLAIKGLAPVLGITDIQETIQQFDENTSQDTISAVKVLHVISQLFLFIITPFLFLGIINYQKPFHYLMLDRIPLLRNIFLGIGITLVSFPIVFFVYWLNQQLPLPGSFAEMESKAMQTVKYFVMADSPAALMTNLFAIALIPALGEELLFRGVLQRIFGKMYKNPHIGIWITAILFSAFHMQFAGFFSRMLLGAMLGYLLYWSASLWVPIIAHFFYNGVQLAGAYLRQQQGLEVNTGTVESFPVSITLISVILVAGLCFWMYKLNPVEQKEYRLRLQQD